MFHLLEKRLQQAFQSHISIRYGVEAAIVIEQPKQADFGELAVPVAFQLASASTLPLTASCTPVRS